MLRAKKKNISDTLELVTPPEMEIFRLDLLPK